MKLSYFFDVVKNAVIVILIGLFEKLLLALSKKLIKLKDEFVKITKRLEEKRNVLKRKI